MAGGDPAGGDGGGCRRSGPHGAYAPRCAEQPRGARRHGRRPRPRDGRPQRGPERRRRGTAAARDRARAPAGRSAGVARETPLNVLVAEDEPVSAKLLAAALKIGGHEATIAPNGGDAWDSWLLAPQRLVISGWEMPEPDGLQLCLPLRGRCRPR